MASNSRLAHLSLLPFCVVTSLPSFYKDGKLDFSPVRVLRVVAWHHPKSGIWSGCMANLVFLPKVE